MFIKSITYGRVRNLGNYQSERLEATIEIDREESSDDALLSLRNWVRAQMGITDEELAPGPPVEKATQQDPPPAAPGAVQVVGGGQATPAQVNAIYSIGRRKYRWDDDEIDTYCRNAFDKLPVDLTKQQASELIGTMNTHTR